MALLRLEMRFTKGNGQTRCLPNLSPRSTFPWLCSFDDLIHLCALCLGDLALLGRGSLRTDQSFNLDKFQRE